MKTQEELLKEAIKTNDTKLVYEILDDGTVDVSYDGGMCLKWAIECCHDLIFDKLIKNKNLFVAWSDVRKTIIVGRSDYLEKILNFYPRDCVDNHAIDELISVAKFRGFKKMIDVLINFRDKEKIKDENKDTNKEKEALKDALDAAGDLIKKLKEQNVKFKEQNEELKKELEMIKKENKNMLLGFELLETICKKV